VLIGNNNSTEYYLKTYLRNSYVRIHTSKWRQCATESNKVICNKSQRSYTNDKVI